MTAPLTAPTMDSASQESIPPPTGGMVDRRRQLPSEIQHAYGSSVATLCRSQATESPATSIPQRRQGRFELLQQFEGTVDYVNGNVFTAHLRDRTKASMPIEIATISLEEVSPDDLKLVAPGAVFYLSVGYRVHPWGQKERSTGIVFRRLPAWTRNGLAEARAVALSWMNDFGVDQGGLREF